MKSNVTEFTAEHALNKVRESEIRTKQMTNKDDMPKKSIEKRLQEYIEFAEATNKFSDVSFYQDVLKHIDNSVSVDFHRVCMNELEAELTQKHEAEIKAQRDKYNELLYEVQSKFPNESRHETALRYIRSAESRDELAQINVGDV